jgi:CHASE2 domain-containing sensor protein
MEQRIETDKDAVPVATAAGGGKPSAEELQAGRKRVLRDLVKGLLFTFLILAIKIGFEHTTFGEQFQSMTYTLLQLRLASPGVSEPLPVAVVDISDLDPAPVSSGGWNRLITPRQPLLNLIDAVARQGVKAIGIDVDFAPDQPGYMSPGDPEFFQSCLDISTSTGVPIFLSVSRSQDLEPEAWLGSTKYKALAATASVRRLDGRRLPKWTRRDEDSESGPSLCSALAKSLPVSVNVPPRGTRWAIIQINEARVPDHKITFGEFLVDYGLLDLIRDKSLRTIKPVVISDQGPFFLKNKVVLLGDGTLGKATDISVVPGQKEPVPGVYLHACAVYTLTKPLYELTGLGRATIDLTLSMLIVAAIAAIRLRARKDELNIGRLQGFFTLMVVLFAYVVGFMFVRSTRIMWDDFILVIAALLLHPSIEKWWHWTKTKVAAFFRRPFPR